MRTCFARLALLVWGLAFTASAACPDAKIDALFSAYDKPNVPGASVLVMRDGEVVFRKAYGLADLEAKRKTVDGTNYRLASVSKQFTAVAILLLADQGKLKLDDKITRFFPNFPAYGKDITVRHLLNHTSGLRDYEDNIPSSHQGQLKDKDVLDILQRVGSGKFIPGSLYSYNNGGYVLLGLIVEAASGMTFHDFLKHNVFEPLGMKHTLMFDATGPAVTERAYGYSPSGSGYRRTDQSKTSATRGDRGVYTSVDELPLWERAIERGELLSPEMWKAAFTPAKLTSGVTTKYGFGWMLDTYRGKRRQHHTGSTIGFRTAMQRYPDDRFMVAVLVNRANSSPWETAQKIVDLCLF